MSTPEQLANAIMQSRGYLVIGSSEPYLRRGDVLVGPHSGNGRGDLEQTVVVTEHTDLADFNEQRRILGDGPLPIDEASDLSFYRTVAE